MPTYREIIEKEIGRKLSPVEVVHHKDSNSFNNSPDNLIVVSNQSTHMKTFHNKNCIIKLFLRIDPETKKKLRDDAWLNKMSMAEYLRYLILGGKSKTTIKEDL